MTVLKPKFERFNCIEQITNWIMGIFRFNINTYYFM